MTAEELDDDPSIFKGQILSCLTAGGEVLLIGLDPGTRIGMAVYYGEANIEFATFDSVEGVLAGVFPFSSKVPSQKVVVRIGNGDPGLAAALARSLVKGMSRAVVEIVDESGTSSRSAKLKGIQGDQRAAAKIAFRKGIPFTLPASRTRE
jgi:hypothetical protein